MIGHANNPFSRYAVTSSGIGSSPLSHYTGDFSPFKLANGLAFVANGAVVDVTSQPNRMIGTFSYRPSSAFTPTNALLAPDPELGRVFFFTSGLLAYDTSTFLQTANVPINLAATEPAGTVPSTVDVVRWGQDGVAALTSSGNIYILRGPAVAPQLLQAGPTPTLGPNAPSSLTHGSGNTVLTLSGTNFPPGSCCHLERLIPHNQLGRRNACCR